MSEDIIYTDSYDFEQRIEHGVRLVLFYSDRCVQSRALLPILEEIADAFYDSIRILAVDVEQSPDLCDVFAIDQTPVVLFFSNGRLAERLNGANPPSAYTDVIDELLQ